MARNFLIQLSLGLVLAQGAFGMGRKPKEAAPAQWSQGPADGKGVYAYQAVDIDGNTKNLSEFKGKVLLIMNTASKCGTTPQYKNLEALYNKYKERGLVALAFPSNDFGHQEPGTNADIKKFCVVEYGITFPIFSKVEVLPGPAQHPLYAYLTGLPEVGGELKWNGVKFLVNRQGRVVARFDSWTKPDSAEVVQALEKLL